MWHRLTARAIWLGSAIGADPADSVDLRVRKSLLVLISLLVLPTGLVWGALYLGVGEPLAAALPIAYTFYSIVAIAIFHVTREFAFLRRAELIAILVTPFVLGVILGGLVASSGAILWSLLAPIGAVAFGDPRRAWRWIAAFLLMVAATTPVAAILRPVPSDLPATVVLAFMALNIGGVSFVVFLILAAFASQRQTAQERADGLLLNILPAAIAEQLKSDRRVMPEHHEEVSVLFADVVDFTPMSARMTPTEVVGTLDELFTVFDELVDRYGVEKIKTIGDAYMVAAGVPSARPDHAQVLARLALDMCEAAGHHQREDGTPIQLRIGINSGPVVAGVIGRRKFIYDLWGDTVNVASRMESHGVPGRIQVAEPTWVRIRDGFVFETRGTIEVKGKGLIRTWYLLREAGSRTVDGAARERVVTSACSVRDDGMKRLPGRVRH